MSGGFGLGTMVQAEPFHDSIKVWKWSVSEKKAPTAMHADGRRQDVPDNWVSAEDETFGLGTTDHTEPFHDSINA